MNDELAPLRQNKARNAPRRGDVVRDRLGSGSTTEATSFSDTTGSPEDATPARCLENMMIKAIQTTNGEGRRLQTTKTPHESTSGVKTGHDLKIHADKAAATRDTGAHSIFSVLTSIIRVA
jgi:hypothetical protein